MIFNNKVDQMDLLLDKIKLLSFVWLKARKITFAFNDHNWWLNSLSCM